MPLSTGSIVGIVFAVLGFLASLSIHYYFLRRKEKREKEKEEREKADLEKGKSDGSTPTVEPQGLTAKPELEGTMLGAVMPKMELDSQPIAELPNISHVRELDGTPSVSGSQLDPNSATTATSADPLLPASTKQHDITYELPG
ncbi:uncharacterized protein GGS22DRAFT_191037 [Annulohypoxylon maeteangense]|uniref:uncharacterized protein n=1 Tax=Annulohypoxylon maeteangense TaxID=1927788 RepID=UPI00200752B6|nr:uncharacterized protein GGS22DRAFT_191037 [Annulohypoxylon maeteangense]KAI0882450.1 hypothetical protein GGS22DRAFT_191037 [Annulohypoxylon maeteangense]